MKFSIDDLKNRKLELCVLAVSIVLILLDVILFHGVSSYAVEKRNAPKNAVTVTAIAQGLNGPVTLEMTATADRIYEIIVTDHAETPELGGVAAEQLPPAIIEAQSLAVDGVTGATVTSDAIKAAVRAGLEAAGFDPAAFE